MAGPAFGVLVHDWPAATPRGGRAIGSLRRSNMASNSGWEASVVAQPVEAGPSDDWSNSVLTTHSPTDPWSSCHDLHLDDRLTLAAVADLADRLPRQSVIADTAAQPLLVPAGRSTSGCPGRPGDVIRDLDNANAWLTLLNVEDDPAMRGADEHNARPTRAGDRSPGRARCAIGWHSSSFHPRTR